MIMNDIDLYLIEAEHLASKINEEFGISEPKHIRLRDIAYLKKALVIERELGSAAASIVIVDNFATIRVKPNDSYTRKRFSIAHELGHLVMGHLNSYHQFCSNGDMMNWYSKTQETQANFFASELILPQKMIKTRADVPEVNISRIQEIACEFYASLTATAIKFVRLCPEQCAVVFSSGGKIRWAYKSSSFEAYIPFGQSLDKRTLAFDLSQGKERESPVEIDADAWIEGSNIDEIVEDSVSSDRYDFVLSILWIRP